MLTETVKRPGMEFVQVDDLIDSDLTDVLKGMRLLSSNNVVTKRSSQASVLLFMLPPRFLEKQASSTP
jgi:hypothetical protein